MAHRRSSRHIVLWRRKTPIPSSHRLNRQLPATSLAACFLAAFLTGVLLLPQCPGFDRVVALSAGLSGPLRQQQTQNSDTQDATSVSEQTVPPSDDDIQPVESSSSALTEDPASEQTESLPAADEPSSEPLPELEELLESASLQNDPEILPENEAVLVHKTYTASPSDVYVQVGNSFVKNVTDYGNQTVLDAEAADPAFTLDADGKVEVLIMHTHTTECYMPYTGSVYDTTCPTRTTDNEQNMAAVGAVITARLQQAGIGVIHDTTQHDYPSYNGSYERSAATVQSYLDQYPDIKVVLDIHRDAIISGDTVTAPVVETDEGTAAQVMIISGCDDGTMDYPEWQKNLAFAIDLQQQMEADHPGFTRPILFDYRKYNQNLTTGSLLIEVGGHGNTLAQALLAGDWIGSSLATLLKNS